MNDVTHFYHSLSDHYDAIFPLNPAVVSFIAKSTTPGSSILDVGCATGSLAIALAETGYKVTGIDLDEALINGADKKSTLYENRPLFQTLNMLDIQTTFVGQKFDVIICMGNTLSHLTPAEQTLFIKQAYSLLRSNGVFVGQIVNYDRIWNQQLDALPTIDTDTVCFERHYNNFSKEGPFQFHTRLTVKQTGVTLSQSIPLYPIFATPLKDSLQNCGFDKVNLYGSFKYDIYTLQSFPLIFKASSNTYT